METTLLYTAITVGTFIFMEAVTWFTHKFIMHGFMWYFHDDHHNPSHNVLEKNDVFFPIFATPSFLLMLWGANHGFDWRFFVGLGVMFYGAAYFLIHDVLIHQRFPWFKKTDNVYFRALRKAHRMHHKHMGKHQGECFGMLLVPMKYFREAKNYKKKLRRK
ncbi:MAG: sterol desaturase family protein [Flavobacterium sp.]|nr:sterol desaturase family protein [Flavobacterium sp.]